MPFLVKEKGSKSSKIRKLPRKFTLPPFCPFLKFLKSTMEVIDMLVRFPRNYYMLRFDKARPLFALFSEKKGSKTSKIRKLTRKLT
jgi:hypothetical protein